MIFINIIIAHCQKDLGILNMLKNDNLFNYFQKWRLYSRANIKKNKRYKLKHMLIIIYLDQ